MYANSYYFTQKQNFYLKISAFQHCQAVKKPVLCRQPISFSRDIQAQCHHRPEIQVNNVKVIFSRRWH